MSSLLAGLDWGWVAAAWSAYWPVVAAATGVASLVVIDRLATRWRIGRVARRLGAVVTRARGDVLPTLEWRDGGRLARLCFPRSEGGLALRATHCRVHLAQPVRFTLDVARRGLLARAALWLPARRGEVRTGHAPFDRCFVIRSADPTVARRWLDREVRRTLVQLARGPGGSAFRLACDGGALVARLTGAVTDRAALRYFAEGAVWLARTVEAAAWESAVAFGPRGDSSTSLGAALCPACAEPAGRTHAIDCPVCRARPHHACWEWLGGCGIYGCAGAARGLAAAA
jgi:hypothetical protein